MGKLHCYVQNKIYRKCFSLLEIITIFIIGVIEIITLIYCGNSQPYNRSLIQFIDDEVLVKLTMKSINGNVNRSMKVDKNNHYLYFRI